MKNIRFDILKLLYGKRICFGEYSLRAFILILAIYVFKVNRIFAGKSGYINTGVTHFVYNIQLTVSYCSNQFIINIVQVADSI